MKHRILTQSTKSTGYSWNVILFGVMAFVMLLWQRFANAQTENGVLAHSLCEIAKC